MKYFVVISILALSLCACKKDYSCYGSETMRYELYTDSTRTSAGVFVQHKFESFETCINCSKKDKDKLIQIMLDYILLQKDEKKFKYEKEGTPVKEEIFIDNELICEEQ